MKTIVTEFGTLEIQEKDIIHFETGIYGFENAKDYVLLNHDEQGIIMTLQTVDGQVPQFVVLDPFAVIADYQPVLSESDKQKLYFQNSDELKYLVIAIVKENYLDTVVNLKSPLVINSRTKQASQVILENDYSMKYRVFDENGGKCSC